MSPLCVVWMMHVPVFGVQLRIFYLFIFFIFIFFFGRVVRSHQIDPFEPCFAKVHELAVLFEMI
jgi:hypothetical protein